MAGRRRGAVLGALVFPAAAMVPGFSLGCFAVLMLSARLAGHALVPGWIGTSLVAVGGLVGAVSAASICILAGWFGGGVIASVAGSFGQVFHDRREEQERTRRGMAVLPHARMAESARVGVRSRLSFLEPCRGAIHSIAIVGSAAHASNEDGSDVDIVIISKEDGLEAVLGAVAEQEMENALSRPGERGLEFTVLSPSQTEKLFKLASPFAYALCRGIVLEDDGCLAGLAARPPRAPGRKYALTTLYQSIMVPYYGSFRALQKNAKKKGCTAGCCADRGAECGGIGSTDMPATVIMRMLYVTLPLRSRMPLAKEDVIAFTEKVYGTGSAEAVRKAVSLTRNSARRITYAEYQQFKRLAGMLYREILGAVGIDRSVSSMLRDGASMMQGNYGALKDRDLRRCVQSR